MHNFFGKLIKYILRLLFFGVAGIFLFGLTKFNFDIKEYVLFLNSLDVREFVSSSGSVIPSQLTSGSLIDDSNVASSGLDVYDPNFENGFMDIGSGNALTGLSQTGESYGFKDPYSSGSQQPSLEKSGSLLTGDSRKDLINLIKREK